MKLLWKLLAVAMFLFLLAVIVSAFCFDSEAEDPGDVIELTAVFRDSLGAALEPDSARLLVVQDNVVIDSLYYLGGPDSAKIEVYGGYLGPTLHARYLIPSVSDTVRFSFYMDCHGDDIDDIIPCAPLSIELTQVADFWASYASAAIDTLSSAEGGEILDGETPITDARVYVTRTSSFSPSAIIGFGYSEEGDYDIMFPVSAALPDTVWIWAWYQGRWLKQATQVIPD